MIKKRLHRGYAYLHSCDSCDSCSSARTQYPCKSATSVGELSHECCLRLFSHRSHGCTQIFFLRITDFADYSEFLQLKGVASDKSEESVIKITLYLIILIICSKAQLQINQKNCLYCRFYCRFNHLYVLHSCDSCDSCSSARTQYPCKSATSVGELSHECCLRVFSHRSHGCTQIFSLRITDFFCCSKAQLQINQKNP